MTTYFTILQSQSTQVTPTITQNHTSNIVDGALAVAKKHGYEKPWLTNSKRGKKKPQDDGDNQRPGKLMWHNG